MPTEEELEYLLDRQDLATRRDRTMAWNEAVMVPSPENDAAEEAEENARAAGRSER